MVSSSGLWVSLIIGKLLISPAGYPSEKHIEIATQEMKYNC